VACPRATASSGDGLYRLCHYSLLKGRYSPGFGNSKQQSIQSLNNSFFHSNFLCTAICFSCLPEPSRFFCWQDYASRQKKRARCTRKLFPGNVKHIFYNPLHASIVIRAHSRARVVSTTLNDSNRKDVNKKNTTQR
jgi:hypothetical protein